MNETTRSAGRRIFGYHCQKFDSPALFAQLGPLPKKFQKILDLDEAFVFGTHDHVTIFRASYVDAAKEPIPFGPWNVPGGIAAAPRKLEPILDLIGNLPILASIGYAEGAGQELVGMGKTKVGGTYRWPVFTIHVKAVSEPSGGRGFALDTIEEKATKHFVCGGMGEETLREVIHLRTEITGQLMRYHSGILEFRGGDTPIILRATGGGMVSIVRPSPPPQVLELKTEREIVVDQRLPGIWNDLFSKLADEEKEEKEPKAKKDKGGKRK